MAEVLRDRREAGRRLGAALQHLQLRDPLVLALPRGGVPVAHEVALALGAPLDLMLVRKLGAPGQPELAIGAIADGSHRVLDEEVMAAARPDPAYVEQETGRQLAEIERRRRAYLGERPRLDRSGRDIVLVDDGIATGSTAKAALAGLRGSGAARIVLAVPIIPQRLLAELDQLADRVVSLANPEPFVAVSLHYRDFEQTSDAEVRDLLQRARR